MHILVTGKNEKDPIKNEDTKVATTVLPLKVCGKFSGRSMAAYSASAAHGPIWPNFELVRDFIDVHVTC